MIRLFVVGGGDNEMNSWTLWGKCTCKIVSTSTLKSVFERGNKECEIGGAYMSYIGIDVWILIYENIRVYIIVGFSMCRGSTTYYTWIVLCFLGTFWYWRQLASTCARRSSLWLICHITIYISLSHCNGLWYVLDF
jgi:hypothetical protein